MSNIDLEYDLLNYIIANELRPGDRIPAISELTDPKHLGISTSKVREQLEVARALGMVEVRSKIGTRLKEYDFACGVRLSLLYAVGLDFKNFEMFTALRNHIEVAFWNEACELLTDVEKAEMRQAVEAAREKLTASRIRIPNIEHRTFHLTVFKQLDNPFVTGLLKAYWDAYNAVELNRYADYSYLTEVWDYHEQILDEICIGDYDTAKATFIKHTQLLRHQPIMKDHEHQN
ncbi:MAG: FadR family transcriptional regulator [Chloroflexi bacterium]|nr:MAG: hypothetical protein CUN54_01595 [Phototrophicales bacterium]RMF79197.1 MAG: FadR family transcriptional regulator [Chloroflexota bacterium]